MTTTIPRWAQKVGVGFVGVAMVFSLVGFTKPAEAQTVSELQAQIQSLLAQMTQLQAQLGAVGGASIQGCFFSRDLGIGSTGSDVQTLQRFLNSMPDTRVAVSGAGSPGFESQYFGPLTASAVSKFQVKYRAEILTPLGLVNPTGYFGASSRVKANSLCAAGGPVTPPSDDEDDRDLEGGAGSIDQYSLISSLNNEEVGEDEEDVEVAGLEMEVDNGSDIELTAVRLVFDEGTATEDFEDYASEVSLWLDGEEVARVDADEFNDDNEWTSTVSLDDGAIIRAGDTGELVVAVSGISNLDSADEGDTWTVDFRQIRFRDADRTTISEDPSTGTRTFSFEAFAAAAGVDLQITRGDSDINNARIISVDATDDTDDVELLSFMLEIDGDSDIELDSLPINFDVTGASNVDDVIHTVTLYVDGDQVGSESLGTGLGTDETVVFEDLDLTLEAGEEYEFIVSADFFSLADNLDEGDTISAQIGETETDSADFDAEDEAGNNVADNDISGSASAGPHSISETGIEVTLVETSENAATEDGADNDSGTFRVVFDVRSTNGTIYVSDSPTVTTASDITASTITTNGVLYRLDDSGTPVDDDVTAIVTYSDEEGNPSDSTNGIEIEEGETARITLTVVRQNDGDASDDGIYQMFLKAIGWNTDDSTTFNVYDFDLGDFESDPLFLN